MPELDGANDTSHADDGTNSQQPTLRRQSTHNPAADALAKQPAGRNVTTGALVTPANSAAQGNSVTGQLFSSPLYGSFFVGPYQFGVGLRNGDLASFDVTMLVGSAVNILVTGWVLNMLAGRASPFDTFGILASTAAQVGTGALLSPMGGVKQAQVQPPPRQW